MMAMMDGCLAGWMNGWMYDTIAVSGSRVRSPSFSAQWSFKWKMSSFQSGKCQVEAATFFHGFSESNAPFVGVDGQYSRD